MRGESDSGGKGGGGSKRVKKSSTGLGYGSDNRRSEKLENSREIS